MCENLRVIIQIAARIYESGCSGVRECTSQDAAFYVDSRVRMQCCSLNYESGYYITTALQCTAHGHHCRHTEVAYYKNSL